MNFRACKAVRKNYFTAMHVAVWAEIAGLFFLLIYTFLFDTSIQFVG